MSNNNSWEIIHMSNRRLQTQSRQILSRRTTNPQQASNQQRCYRLLVGGHRRPGMVPVFRQGTGSLRLNNNRFFTVARVLFSGHGGSHQARRLPHQFVTALAIRRFLRMMSQINNPVAMSANDRLRAARLPPPPPAQNLPPPVNNTMVNEGVRSDKAAPREESATEESGGSYINLLDKSLENGDEGASKEPDLTLKL